jgi:hypothetical protein
VLAWAQSQRSHTGACPTGCRSTADLRAAPADLQLDFPADQQERRQLPNGTEYFGASGTITNVGSEAQSVPPILIVLRDGRDRIVYSFEVQPPKRSLAPGESVTGERGGDRRAALGPVRRDRLEAGLTGLLVFDQNGVAAPAELKRGPLSPTGSGPLGLAHDRRGQDLRHDRRCGEFDPARGHRFLRRKRGGGGQGKGCGKTHRTWFPLRSP